MPIERCWIEIDRVPIEECWIEIDKMLIDDCWSETTGGGPAVVLLLLVGKPVLLSCNIQLKNVNCGDRSF